jgi:hypothetical protein
MAKSKLRTRRKAKRGVRYAEVCRLAKALPGVEEDTSYGTPALKVKKKLMARLWEDGETLVLLTTIADRERLLAAAPEALFLTDHYLKHPWILVRLPMVERTLLRELIEGAWRLVTEKG